MKAENNSLNLSNSDVWISDKFFNNKDLSLKIAFNIKPKLNSIIISDTENPDVFLFPRSSFSNNFLLSSLNA